MTENKNLKKILEIASEYPLLQEATNKRRENWVTIVPVIHDVLSTVVEALSQNEFFKDSIHLSSLDNIDANTTVAVTMRDFKLGDWIQKGFIIAFQPTINNRLHCFAFGFYIEKRTDAEFYDLATIEHEEVNPEKIFEIFADAFEKVKSTSIFRLD